MSSYFMQRLHMRRLQMPWHSGLFFVGISVLMAVSQVVMSASPPNATPTTRPAPASDRDIGLGRAVTVEQVRARSEFIRFLQSPGYTIVREAVSTEPAFYISPKLTVGFAPFVAYAMDSKDVRRGGAEVRVSFSTDRGMPMMRVAVFDVPQLRLLANALAQLHEIGRKWEQTKPHADTAQFITVEGQLALALDSGGGKVAISLYTQLEDVRQGQLASLDELLRLKLAVDRVLASLVEVTGEGRP